MTFAFDTAYFREQQGGMLVCGTSWGGDPVRTAQDPDRDRYYRSFFSDTSRWVMNRCRYRDRIVAWLAALGLDLKSSPAEAGPLERSISQTNWLPDQSPNTAHQNDLSRCVAERDFFFRHLEHVRPSFILFLSYDLLRALNAPQCLPRAEAILGNACVLAFESRDAVIDGHKHPRFKVGIQTFERAVAIALPHPASRGQVRNEYIASFTNTIGLEFADYRRRIARKYAGPHYMEERS